MTGGDDPASRDTPVNLVSALPPPRAGGPGTAGRPGLRQETACALCGARTYAVVGHHDRDGRPLRTVMCERCGLVWTNPRPSDADVDQYYATTYRVDYTRHAAPSRRKILRGLTGAAERIEALGRLWRAGVRVMDVGCGAGEFVFLLRARGIDAAGVEPGEMYADFSRRELGIPIETATVDVAHVPPASQDVVTMFHMLEHVADPRRVLATIGGWLRPGGVLVVEVPNVASRAQAPRHRFHFAHLHNFTTATLGALGESVGLTLLRAGETADGGNVVCQFEQGGARARVVESLPDNVNRMRDVFRRHTSLRHYLTVVPYRRVLGRLALRLREDRLLRRLPTTAAVLRWGVGQVGGRGGPTPESCP